jgi:hypothetical protein
MSHARSRESKRALTTRRAFLKAVGAAAAALPFYRMLENNVVLADTGSLPLKFLGVGTYHATSHQFYYRRNAADATTNDIGYADSALRPFDDAATYGHSFKDKLIVFDGFDYGVGLAASGGAEVSMHGAMGLLLTGSTSTGGSNMNYTLQNASLDQFLAAKYGGTTRFRSVELTTENDNDLSSFNTIAYGEGGQPLSRMASPQDIWDKFFASLVVPNDPAAKAAAQRQAAIQASILDFVASDIQRLNGRLAGPEKQKLDQHLTVVRDLEKRLGGSAGVSAGCVAPTRHPESGNANPSDNYVVANMWNGGTPYFDKIADFQIDLLAEMFICDLTRFGTIVFANTSGPTTPETTVPVLGGGDQESAATGTDRPIPEDFHNSIAHKSGSSALDVQQAVATVSRYYNGKIARLMQRLQDAGVLDSTLILIGNEGGDGSGHSIQHVPLILAGGANGAITMGRRIVAPERTPVAGAQCKGASVTSHNPILVAIANAFGANITSFGTCADPKFTAGVSGLV